MRNAQLVKKYFLLFTLLVTLGNGCESEEQSTVPTPSEPPSAAKIVPKEETKKAPIVPTAVQKVVPAKKLPKPTPPQPAANNSCDKNYSGCVPIASDVDCAGGSGNGPAYVAGPVTVLGSDIYGLDRDHDGLGCE